MVFSLGIADMAMAILVLVTCVGMPSLFKLDSRYFYFLKVLVVHHDVNGGVLVGNAFWFSLS